MSNFNVGGGFADQFLQSLLERAENDATDNERRDAAARMLRRSKTGGAPIPGGQAKRIVSILKEETAANRVH